MKYKYGVVDKFAKNEGVVVKAPQLIDLIRRDVLRGKWNIYEGGDERHNAKISYKGKNFTYGEHIFIVGSKREIQFLESKISQYLKVVPRVFSK